MFSCIIPSSDNAWKKVDHAETYHDEVYNTGYYNVVGTDKSICVGGEDYLSCVNSHVTMYNSICADKLLTSSAKLTCDSLDSFINDVKSRYKSCGYGCTTRGGSGEKWGWNYYTSSEETETKKVSNNDEVTHIAHCYTNIWGSKWGECE